MPSKWKITALGILVAFCTASLGLISVPASANPDPSVFPAYERVQRGESVAIYPNVICPAPDPNDYWAHVRVLMTDADNKDLGYVYDANYTVIDIGATAIPGSGSWNKGILTIPEEAALGPATVTVICTSTPTDWSYDLVIDQMYVPFTLMIVEQTDAIAVDKTHVWSTATFESITPCIPASPVEIELYSQQTFGDGPTAVYAHRITDTVQANAGGHWEYVLDMHPANGFSEYYIDPAVGLEPRWIYTLRVACIGHEVSDYHYDSFKFAMLADEYALLGDSYSSGLGSFNYDLAGPLCYRSSDGYAYYLVDNLNLGLPNVAACSGAVTNDIVRSYGQTRVLTEDTRYVTLTIGGNDLGFADVLKECVKYTGYDGYGCRYNSTLVDPVYDRLDALEGIASSVVHAPNGGRVHALTDVLTSIATAAPNAEIYIAGYPRLFGEDSADYIYESSAPGGYMCRLTSGLGPIVTFSFDDAQWVNMMVGYLNEAIEDAVDTVQPLNVTYVSPSTFDGSGLCDEYAPYINRVTVNQSNEPEPESFHPNLLGMQLGYGVAFKEAIE